MRKTLALALGAMLAFSGIASAQPEPKKGKDGGPKDGGPKAGASQDAEVQKLRDRVKELEGKLKAQSGDKKGPGGFGPGGFGGGGFGKFDPEKMKEMREKFAKEFGDKKKDGKFDAEKFKEMAKRWKDGQGKEAGKGKGGDRGAGPGSDRKGPPPWAKGGKDGERRYGPGSDRKGPGARDGDRRGGPQWGRGPGGFGRGPGAPGGRGPGGFGPQAGGRTNESRRIDDLERKVDEILRILRDQRGPQRGGYRR